MTNGIPLREFEFTPTADDAAYHFDSARRKAAAQLLSSVYQGDGLFFLAGDSGIGKSTLLRHLHRQIAALEGVVLLSPAGPLPCRKAMTLPQILEACDPALQLGTGADPLKLARRLQQLSEEGCVPVLLADDADLLDEAALDALATLTGLQAGQRRLLSAVLAGSPGLPARLALPPGDEMLPEGHRVVALQPLGEGAVARLLHRRLSAAFEPDAAIAIAHAAGGVPARVLEIGERALQLASLRSSAAVTSEIAAAAYRREPAPGFAARPAKVAPVAADGTHPFIASFASMRPAPEPPPPELSSPKSPFSEPPPPSAGATPFAMPTLDTPVGVQTARRLKPTRRRSTGNGAGIGAKLAIAGGVCFAILLAMGSALFVDDEPVEQTPDRSVQATAAARSAPSRAADPPASVADVGANGSEAGSADRGWRPPSWEQPSAQTGDPHTPGMESSGLEVPQPGIASRESPSSIAATNRMGSAPAQDADSNASISTPAPHPEITAPSPAPAPVRPAPRPTAEESAASRRDTANFETPAAKSRAAAPPTASRSESASVERSREPATGYPAEASSATRGSPNLAPPSATGVLPSRKRQIAVLLDDGDALLQGGDLEAARASYENAFERGSGEAARRLAETFDPRSHPPSSKQASPEEAILWYQDAARKGDHRAAAELEELETWLENSAASGDREARRVLDAWRTPAEPETEPEESATP